MTLGATGGSLWLVAFVLLRGGEPAWFAALGVAVVGEMALQALAVHHYLTGRRRGHALMTLAAWISVMKGIASLGVLAFLLEPWSPSPLEIGIAGFLVPVGAAWAGVWGRFALTLRREVPRG